MASATYEKVLEEAQQLTEDERHQLLRALLDQQSNAVTVPARSEHDQATVEAWQVRWDALSRRIGDAWTDPSIDAVQSVREQRRDL